MSCKFLPDVIAAAELLKEIRRIDDPAVPLSVSADYLYGVQEEYAGLAPDILLRNEENGDIAPEDYVRYFRRFPEYFTAAGDPASSRIFRVNVAALTGGDCGAAQERIRERLLAPGSYSPYELELVGLGQG